jgi:serine/threonine-protein kinase/endoribonuclease IRE1
MVLIYLAAVIFTVSLTCLAETISLSSLRDRSGSVSTNVDIHGRRQIPVAYRFLPPATGGTGSDDDDENQLLDIVLVASVDGKFHALDRTSGHRLWSMSSSSASSTPPGLAPLVRTTHVESDPDTTDDDSPHQELYVIEPQTGEIYVMPSPTSPLQRLPFTMSQLVDMSPFSFAGDEDRRVFVGKKETSLLLVELETGKVKATLNSECPWNPFDDLTEKATAELDLDDLEGEIPISTSTDVFIGRTGAFRLVSINGSKFIPSQRLPYYNTYTSSQPIVTQTSCSKLIILNIWPK